MIHLPIYQEPKPLAITEQIKPLLDSDCPILIAFSGGKDSVAMVLALFDLGIAHSRITLHHHEVDGRGSQLFDWACTTSYCQAFADAFELPIVFSWREGGIKREIYRENEGLQPVLFETAAGTVKLESRNGGSTRRKFPAVVGDLRTRWCSSVVKIDVMSRIVNNTHLSGDLLILTGERRAESPKRSTYEASEKYRSHTKKRNAYQWRPIIDFTDAQVWDLYKKYSVQPHPCYMLGWSRCSCQTCIFSSPNTWASIKQLSPEKITELTDMEQELGHTLYNGSTIPQMVAKGSSFIAPQNLTRWGSEAIGMFISPIFVDNWILPAGANSVEASGSL